MTTTIEVSRQFARTWKRWRRHYGMTSVQLGDRFEAEVKAHKQRSFYSTLPMPSNFKKPLEGKRVVKKV